MAAAITSAIPVARERVFLDAQKDPTDLHRDRSFGKAGRCRRSVAKDRLSGDHTCFVPQITLQKCVEQLRATFHQDRSDGSSMKFLQDLFQWIF
jgi:hypothetical protein